jgi:hypothetical protein
MDNVKSFKEYLQENKYFTEDEIKLLNENLTEEMTAHDEAKIDKALDEFVAEYLNGVKDINDFNDEITNEGVFGSILGGLTGLALGKTVGKLIAKVLGIKKGFLYNLLTSKLVGAAVGAALGNKLKI